MSQSIGETIREFLNTCFSPLRNFLSNCIETPRPEIPRPAVTRVPASEIPAVKNENNIVETLDVLKLNSTELPQHFDQVQEEHRKTIAGKEATSELTKIE